MKFLFLAGASAISLAAFIANEANAQSTANPIEHCRETSDTDKQRIACLEAAIMGLTGAGQPPAVAEAEPKAEEDETAEARLAAEERGVESDAAEDARLAAAEREAEPEPTGLGAEQVTARQERKTKEGRERRKEREEAEAVREKIADFALTATKKLIIVLENGQVWRQIDGDTQQLNLSRDASYTAEISSGFLSGYELHIPEERRTIRVRRLQ